MAIRKPLPNALLGCSFLIEGLTENFSLLLKTQVTHPFDISVKSALSPFFH